MNNRVVFRILRKLLLVEGILLLLPMIVSIIYGESTFWCFLVVSSGLIGIGLVRFRKKVDDQNIYTKDGLVIVGLAWIFWSMCGALPFVLSGAIPNYIDAVFETVSGFTTTGSTVLNDIESLPKGVLFWRSFTHFIGGMGVLVFVMAIIPLAKERNMYIMKAEVPGPTVGKLVPKTGDTAKILYGIYIALTVIETVMLLFGGMNLFDAVTHAMGTAGTGGFSTKNASIAAFNSTYIDVVITVFMLLFSINFNIFYLLLIKKARLVFKNEELRAFIGIVAAAILAITFNIMSIYGSFGTSLRFASFQVSSVVSTTGFCTADYVQWPMLSQTILLVLMFLGACAGSTGGGLKIVRVVLLGKIVKRDLRKVARPRLVSSIRMDGAPVEEGTVRGIYTYITVFLTILIVSTLLIALEGHDITTTFSSVATCINNVGPGMSVINGPSGNFSFFSSFSKIILSLDMLIGRLEIFPILMILMPSMWKKKIF